MNISGQEAYVLPDRYFGNPKPKETYIFSDDELSALFSAIDVLPEDHGIPYTRQMLPVLFRLIYTCGLRPQEGRELKRRNINLQTGEILITNTKKRDSLSCLTICLRFANTTIRCASFSMRIIRISFPALPMVLWTASG